MRRLPIVVASGLGILCILTAGRMFIGRGGFGPCASDLSERRAKYTQLMDAGKYWDASLELRACAEAAPLQPNLRLLVDDAEIKDRVETIESPSTPNFDKIRAIEVLQRDHPTIGVKYADQKAQLIADLGRTNPPKDANSSDIAQADKFLADLPAGCSASSRYIGVDGSVGILVRCGNTNKAFAGTITIKHGVVTRIE